MNVKLVEISNYLPGIIRFFGIAIWGAVAFFLLSAPIASAEEHPHGDHDSLVLMKPSDLPAGAQVPGEDMYLYEKQISTDVPYDFAGPVQCSVRDLGFEPPHSCIIPQRLLTKIIARRTLMIGFHSIYRITSWNQNIERTTPKRRHTDYGAHSLCNYHAIR